MPAWNEREEGAPGLSLPPPPSLQPGGSGAGRALVFISPVTRAGGLALRERGLGGTAVAARAKSFDLADGSLRELAHVTPARPRVAGFGGRGGEKGLGWGGEPCVSRYRSLSRMNGGGGEGDHFVLAPPC